MGKRKSLSVKSVLFSLLIVCFLFSGANLPAEAAQYNWKMAMPWPVPAQDAFHKQFIELVKEYSGGKIEITYYPDGQLGTHDEIFHSVQDGSVEIGLEVIDGIAKFGENEDLALGLGGVVHALGVGPVQDGASACRHERTMSAYAGLPRLWRRGRGRA